MKVITHYGEFTGYNVKNFYKLIGKDIIVAHQLLKNDIEQHEYWLVTKDLSAEDPPADLKDWMKWNSSAKKTEIGEIAFHYTQLSPLKDQLPSDDVPELELTDKEKVISVTRDYETDIITLFHATGDFNYRSRWQEGVKAVEEVGHFLPRIGMRCRCIMEDGKTTIFSSSYTYHPERIEFSETEENKRFSTYYILEKIEDNKTRLTLDYYLAEDIATRFIFKVFKKKKMEASFQRSLKNIEKVVREIRLPAQVGTLKMPS